jgi:ABC-type transport system involved in multi-copper enzyme maturation permease subunit
MRSLIAIEWLKIKTFRTFWIIAGFFMVLLPLWNYGISNGIMKFGGNNISLISKAYSFSSVWQNLGFWTSIFAVFISILVIIITTNEYQFRTNRQNVIDGWSRLDFYHAKWQMVLLLSVLTTAYVFLTGIAFGVSYSSIADFPGNIGHLFFTWLLVLNYYSFSLLLSILFKRSGITIGIFFLYCMIIESLVGKFINWVADTNVGNFLPLQSSDELLPFPVLEAVKTMAGLQDTTNIWFYVAASVAWIIIYYIIGRTRLLRSDW